MKPSRAIVQCMFSYGQGRAAQRGLLATTSSLLLLAFLVSLCGAGCAPQKRRRGGSEYKKAQARRAVQELEASRSAKFAQMHRASLEAEKKSTELESRLAEREAEVTRLQSELAQAQAASGEAQAASAQVGELRAQLEQTETQLARLREESSSGPFEKEPKKALEGARAEIDSLKEQLAREREEREDLARRFEDLKRNSSSSAGAAASGEKETKLRTQLLHMMGTLEKDLADSREREQAMRLELAQARAVSAAEGSIEVVSSLKAQNAELQSRLDEAQKANRQLESKLAAASRVSELIFRMRESSGQPAER